MSRISLRETYDNRSVIAQIAKVTDTAEDAAETVEQKAAEINDALTDVNAAVQAAEGAVTTANAASASAQASAQTVAGYNTRLTTAEGEIDTLHSDLNSVTLRVQTAEGNIVTIQGRVTAVESKNTQQDTAISALQTADTQNVKINAINDYAVGLTGNQTALGNKTWDGNQTLNRNLFVVRTGTDVTVIPASAFNTLVKEIYDGNSHLNASEFVTKNPNGATWNVRNFFHYFRDENDTVHVVRVGIYYTIENTPTTAIVKRVINIFIDGTSMSSETEYTKTVNL